MIAIRFKKNQKDKYSIYLDIRIKDEKGKIQRSYEFLRIYVSRDYSKSKRIAEADREKMELAQSIRSKRELEIYGTVKGLNESGRRVNLSLLAHITDEKQKSNRPHYEFLIQHLKGFSKNKDILFSDVTIEFIEEFDDIIASNY